MAPDDDIASQHARIQMMDPEMVAKFDPHPFVEKGDLSFVIGIVVEKAIAADPSSRNALDGLDFTGTVVPSRLSVMPKKIVALRDEDMSYMHLGDLC